MSFFCCNKLGRRRNTCSTLISVDFGAACSLSCYIVETSAKHRRCQLERLWQADCVSDFRKQASIRNKDLTSGSRYSPSWGKFGFDFLHFKRECFRFNESRASMSNRPHQIRSMSKQPACQAAAAIKPQRHIKPYSPPAAYQNVQRIEPQQINSTRMSSNIKKSTSTSKRQAQTSMSKTSSMSSRSINQTTAAAAAHQTSSTAAAYQNVQHVKPQHIRPPAAHQTSSIAAADQTASSTSM